MPSKTIAIVLAGGHVGQYGALTTSRAKAALPFAGMLRVVDFAISNLRNSFVEQIGIVIQYLPKSLIEHVEVGLSWDLYGQGKILKIMPPFVGIGKTEWYKGTGDAIHRNLDFIRRYSPDNVLVCSGEQIYHIDFADIIRFHNAHDADLTIVSKYMEPEQISPRFGRLVCDEDNFIVRQFVEKPPQHESRQVCIGMFIFKTSVLTQLLNQMVDKRLGYNLSTHVVALAPDNHRVLNFEFHGYWNYLETVEDYYDANMLLLKTDSPIDLARWEIVTNPEDRGLGYRSPTFLGRHSYVADSLISPGCQIEGSVVRSILSPGVVVERDAHIEDSILFHDCQVGAGARLERVISDKDAAFAPGAHLGRQFKSDKNKPTQKGKLTIIEKGLIIEAEQAEAMMAARASPNVS